MKIFLIFLAGFCLVSCAARKQSFETAVAPVAPIKKPAEPVVIAPPQPVVAAAQTDDGLRMPDMLAMPTDNQLRSSAVEKPVATPIIVQPPAE